MNFIADLFRRHPPLKVMGCWLVIIPAGLYGFYVAKKNKDKQLNDKYFDTLQNELKLKEEYEHMRGRRIKGKSSDWD